MAGLRFTDLQSRPMEFLDFTSLTLDEFQQLVPPFEKEHSVILTAQRKPFYNREKRNPSPMAKDFRWA
jgi:hypothetical protein